MLIEIYSINGCHLTFYFCCRHLVTSDMAAETSEIPTKRQRMEPEVCAIHCTDDTSELVLPRDVDPWKTLVRAAEIRNHADLVGLARTTPEGEVPRIWYHRKCRSIFTMKKLLDAYIPKLQAAGSSARPPRVTPSTSKVLEEKCIFCDKTNKYIKGQKIPGGHDQVGHEMQLSRS